MEKLLLLTDNYPPQRGGMAQSCDRIVQSIRGENIEVHVLHFGGRSKQITSHTQLNGSYTSVPFEEDEAHTIHIGWLHITNSFFKGKYTHILAFGGYLSLMAAPVFSQWLNVPLYIMFRGNDFDQAVFTSRKISVLQRAIDQAVSIGTVTQEMQKRIQLMNPNKRVIFTPNSIDTQDWQPLKSDIDFVKDFRSNEGIDDKKVLGFFGHLKPKKGIDFFIKGLLKSNKAEHFHLLLIGEMQETTMSLIHEKGISNTILTFKDRFELIKYYLCCDAIVLPSFYDGMPNVLLEACALKIPVIASNVAGMHDVLSVVEKNLLFKAGNITDCITVLNRFLRMTSEEVERLAFNQFERIRQKFTKRNELERIIQLFRQNSLE